MMSTYWIHQDGRASTTKQYKNKNLNNEKKEKRHEAAANWHQHSGSRRISKYNLQEVQETILMNANTLMWENTSNFRQKSICKRTRNEQEVQEVEPKMPVCRSERKSHDQIRERVCLVLLVPQVVTPALSLMSPNISPITQLTSAIAEEYGSRSSLYQTMVRQYASMLRTRYIPFGPPFANLDQSGALGFVRIGGQTSCDRQAGWEEIQ